MSWKTRDNGSRKTILNNWLYAKIALDGCVVNKPDVDTERSCNKFPESAKKVIQNLRLEVEARNLATVKSLLKLQESDGITGPSKTSLLAAIERLEQGSRSYNPYWSGSEDKLKRIVDEVLKLKTGEGEEATLAEESLNQALNNSQSSLYKSLDSRRWHFFGKNIDEHSSSIELINGPKISGK